MVINYDKYPPLWKKEIVPRIRAQAGDRCELCHILNYALRGTTKIVLTIHHIGIPKGVGAAGSPHDKDDVRDENLIALCQSCHFAVEREIKKLGDAYLSGDLTHRCRDAAARRTREHLRLHTGTIQFRDLGLAVPLGYDSHNRRITFVPLCADNVRTFGGVVSLEHLLVDLRVPASHLKVIAERIQRGDGRGSVDQDVHLEKPLAADRTVQGTGAAGEAGGAG